MLNYSDNPLIILITLIKYLNNPNNPIRTRSRVQAAGPGVKGSQLEGRMADDESLVERAVDLRVIQVVGVIRIIRLLLGVIKVIIGGY